MALASPVAMPLRGHAEPRIAPPRPARSLIVEYRAAAVELGIDLMPWQDIAAQYMTALGPADRWLFRSYAEVVARQNGKTEKLKPYILMQLRRGRRILHTAQNRAIPRETFLGLAVALDGDPDVVDIRYANGQEVIKFANGARYTLVAPRPGVRGNSVDDVILDEVREQSSFDLIQGIKPTLTASKDPHILYLSNAGDADSVVLNDLRRQRDTDPSLCYLEWSMAPERELDDREGWAEANPAMGITIQEDTLEDFYRTLPAPVFETEHGCRWVISMQPSLVSEAAWLRGRGEVETPRRTMLALSMDANSKRASGVIAWQQSDGSIGVRVVADVIGSPIDVDRLGPDLRTATSRLGIRAVAFDPWTDAELAKHFPTAKPLTGREWANACENFVRLVEGGKLHWDDADAVTADLAWTARKPHESGAWQAVKAQDDRAITASLAAVRAVWLASGPKAVRAKVL